MRTAHAPLWLSRLDTSSGCCFYDPELPKGPKLAVEAGKRIDLGRASHDIMYACLRTGTSRDCVATGEGLWRPATYETVDFRYGDRSLEGRELRELVGPAYDKKLAKIRSYRSPAARLLGRREARRRAAGGGTPAPGARTLA